MRGGSDRETNGSSIKTIQTEKLSHANTEKNIVYFTRLYTVDVEILECCMFVGFLWNKTV